MMRGNPSSEVIAPEVVLEADGVNVAEVSPVLLKVRFVLGGPKCGVLRALSASARNSNLACPAMPKLLNSERSVLAYPGPLQLSVRGALP